MTQNIAVIAANGKSGQLIVREAVDRGLDVTAVVRGENKTVARHAIIKDLFDLTAADLAGFDVVVDAFGAWTPETLPQHPEIKTISGCLCVWARPQPSWRLRPAAAWKIQYLAEDGSWKDVEPTEDYTIVRNSPASRADTDAKGWSTVTFKPVTTKSLRLVLTPHTGSSTFGAAVAEWGVHGIDGTESEPTPVDKTVLKSAFDTANGLDASRYTAASWAEFQRIIDAAQAVYDDANATEEQVAEQVTKLEDGQKARLPAARRDRRQAERQQGQPDQHGCGCARCRNFRCAVRRQRGLNFVQ